MGRIQDMLGSTALVSHLTGANNYSWVHFSDRSRLLLSKSLSYLEQHLPGFVRVHKTALINPAHIASMEAPPRPKMAGSIVMRDGTTLPVGRRRWPDVAELLAVLPSKRVEPIEAGERRVVYALMRDDQKLTVLSQLMQERWPHYKLCAVTDEQTLHTQLSRSATEQLPALILLDGRETNADVHQILRSIRRSDRLGVVPIVWLTSLHPTDSALASLHTLGINPVPCPPANSGQFRETLVRVCHYWFSTVALPVFTRAN